MLLITNGIFTFVACDLQGQGATIGITSGGEKTPLIAVKLPEMRVPPNEL